MVTRKEGEFIVPDKDFALFIVLEGMDYEAQLRAVRNLLQRHRHSDKNLEDEIKRIDEFARRTTGIVNEQAVSDWVDHLHASVYQDAAHSMAAVGMLAPLVESIFCQSFNGIGRILGTDLIRGNAHRRWQWSAEHRWDCHFVCAKTGRRHKNFLAGVSQLADAVGLSAHLPTDLTPTLQALFEYRNKMFHGGFEWSIEERQRFHNNLEKWPSDWFTMATSDDKPWVFYMTNTFVAHCLTTIDKVFHGVGTFYRLKSLRT